MVMEGVSFGFSYAVLTKLNAARKRHTKTVMPDLFRHPTSTSDLVWGTLDPGTRPG
jgi:hypothetical protein